MLLLVPRVIAIWFVLGFATLISEARADEPFEALRLELSVIGSQIEDLRSSLLSPEVRSLGPGDAGIVLLRLDALEAKLRAAVGSIEALEFHLEILSRDARHRISEFKSKLFELEKMNNGFSSLNTDITASESANKNNGKKLLTENSNSSSDETLAFDKALLSINSNDFNSALIYLEAFIESYPDSRNVAEAFYWLGKANSEVGNYKRAATTFLESFSRAPDSVFAWKSLLGLAVSLGDLGQMEQGCLTLGELDSRFPEQVIENLEAITIAEKQLKCAP